MILPFSTKLNGKETLFVERITKSLLEYAPTSEAMSMYKIPRKALYSYPFKIMFGLNGKHHTIRIDKNKRWKEGNLIHPIINNRSSSQIQFAPTIKCISTQSFLFKIAEVKKVKSGKHYYWDGVTGKIFAVEIRVGSKKLSTGAIRVLALNDGFNSTKSFIEYFASTALKAPGKVFKGKIIHWTDLKY